MSFPLHNHEGSALAICSHFLEFLPVDSAGSSDPARPQLAHQLEKGQRYVVVLTTGGGLYRYQLHDLIEVVGHTNQCPLIRFLGRQNYVCDWFGEKLDEAYVSEVLRKVFDAHRLSPVFAMLACDADDPAPGYVLYVDSASSDDLLHRVATNVESRLRENFHYNYARQLRQLAPLRVFRAENAAESFLRAKNQRGQRSGSIKLCALDAGTGWSHVFRGQFISQPTPSPAVP